MLSKICSFIWGKLPVWPELGRKRSLDDGHEYPARKYSRLEDSTALFRLQPETAFKFSNRFPMQAKENFSEEDECKVVSEVPQPSHRKKLIPVKKLMKNEICGNSRKLVMKEESVNQSTSQRKPTVITLSDDKDVEIVDVVKCNPLTRNNVSKFKPGRIFTTPRVQTMKKSYCRSQKPLPRHLNCRQECWRLEEKLQYLALLKSQTSQVPELTAPFKIARPERCSKSSIPVVDLTDEKSNIKVNRESEYLPITCSSADIEIVAEIPRVNSLKDILQVSSIRPEDVAKQILADHTEKGLVKFRIENFGDEETKLLCERRREDCSKALEERIRSYMKITEPSINEVEEATCVLPELTPEQEMKITAALKPNPPNEILSERFGLQIKRCDIQTLKGLNWLNDEVINFYMNLIMERSKNSSLPRVYSFNTFFYPKLISGGHSSLKRWTKKVDVFSFDVILVPIHLGMHWCMAIIDFKSKEVRYYDSMGSPNDRCLQTLLYYLEAESLDKKKIRFDTEDWEQINVDDIPQQMNGSDCGVFSCMFAEYVAREAAFSFSQDHMPYFRRKMIIEILLGKLIT